MRKSFLFLSFLCGALILFSSVSMASPDRTPSRRASQTEIDGAVEAPSMAAVPAAQSSSGVGQEYTLGVGDRLKLTVYGEADLSGEYEVGSTGFVAMPLIGDIPVAGHSLRAFETAVRNKLAQGYLRDPRVSAQVINYRPFFILGEVAKPGSYPYVNGMNVLNAVALAGGYTYRADKSGVTLTKANDPEKKEQSVPEESTVMPGDIIRVPERFF